MELTKHAAERMQQRGIPPLIISACIDHGSRHHISGGSIVYHIDKKAKRRLERSWGRSVTRKLSEFMDSYIVVAQDDGVIITTGKRFKKIQTM